MGFLESISVKATLSMLQNISTLLEVLLERFTDSFSERCDRLMWF